MCLVFLDHVPFVVRRMVDVLSWWKMLWLMWYPYASRKYSPHSISPRSSSRTTSSASVELLTLIFFPIDILIRALKPIFIIILVWPLQSEWVPHYSSTYQWILCIELIVNTDFIFLYPLNTWGIASIYPNRSHMVHGHAWWGTILVLVGTSVHALLEITAVTHYGEKPMLVIM